MKVHMLMAGEKQECKELLKSINLMFEEPAWEVVHDGKHAVKAASRMEDLALAFVDVRLPPGDGIRIAGEILRYQKDCQIIYLVNYEDFGTLMKSPGFHTAGYLLRPFSRTGMEAAVQKVCGRWAFLQKMKEGNKDRTPGSDENDLRGNEKSREWEQAEVVSYLAEHFRQEITLEDLADEFKTSRTYVCKRFKQLFGENFSSYLKRLRVEDAKRLLLESQQEVRDIAFETGFQNAAYFTKVFREQTGTTPSEYRKRYRNNQ